jgi:hypothetical protein
VVGSCEYGDEPSGFCATELVWFSLVSGQLYGFTKESQFLDAL